MLSVTLDSFRLQFKEIASQKQSHIAETTLLFEEMKSQLQNVPPDITEVKSLLKAIVVDPGIPIASLVLISAWYNPSQDYLPELCEIVRSPQAAAWHEQAIDLMGELKNPESVRTLAIAVTYRWEFDESRCVPIKALEALAEMDTAEANAIIKQAVDDEDVIVRIAAAELLEGMSE